MSFTKFVYSSFASTQPNDGKTGGLNVIISVMKNMHSTKFGDYEVTNLDETQARIQDFEMERHFL